MSALPISSKPDIDSDQSKLGLLIWRKWERFFALRRDGSNPCRHVPKYREKKRSRFLTQAELSRIGSVLSACEADSTESPFVIAAFRLLLLTGCRLGEIQTLQ